VSSYYLLPFSINNLVSNIPKQVFFYGEKKREDTSTEEKYLPKTIKGIKQESVINSTTEIRPLTYHTKWL